MDKDIVVNTFDEISNTYNHSTTRFFPFTADRLVGLLRPEPGSKILDVATGTGVVAMAMAQAVGQQGRVLGVDLSEGMLAQAEASIKKFGMDNIDLFSMDASRLDFKNNYFDYVTCSFGIFFMPDMLVALKEWLRVLKPGGRLIFTCFGENAFQPMMDRLVEQLAEFGVEQEKLMLSSQRLNRADACESLLREAGVDGFTQHELQMGYHLRDQNEWWDVISSSAIRKMVEQLPAERRDPFKTQHLASLGDLLGEQGLWFDVPVWANIASKA